ncbi:MAG: amino acid ABC transporter permease [Pseudomonadota bacterium]
MAVESDPRYSSAPSPAKVSPLYDPKVRGMVAQIVLLVIVVGLGYGLVTNTYTNLQKGGIASGFGFLSDPAGFGIIQALIPYTESSSYLRVFFVGLLNTILVAVIGIILATILGFIVGIARLSSNWLVSTIAWAYIEVMRNIPLLLHLFIWYFAVLRALPAKRDEPISFFDTVFLNIFGIWAPALITADGFWMTLAAIPLAVVVAWGVSRWAKARQLRTGQPFPSFWVGLGILIAIPLAVFAATGMPATWEHPVFKETGPLLRRGFQQDIGLNIIPEFIALLLALTIYTAGFIAETVRAGIQSVHKGQTEAARSLGLRPNRTTQLVVIPQAMRVIIPPLTSQYLNLTKNSSLAVAIAYPDLVSVFAGTSLNQTGQAVEIVLMVMAVYLTLSLLTSALMNWYNARVALVER